MKSRRVLVTAGPTREWMDPVRYLSNPSSGAMGIEIADELARRGHRVTLVLGPTHLTPSRKVQTIPVVTALEMHSKVKKAAHRADAFIATAAVGDWRFAKIARTKLKKTRASTMSVRLVKNPDILATTRSPIKVGFALESSDLKKNALKKLSEKGLDLIIANDPRSFAGAMIHPTLIERDGGVRKFPSMTKKSLALKIAQWLEAKWKTN